MLVVDDCWGEVLDWIGRPWRELSYEQAWRLMAHLGECGDCAENDRDMRWLEGERRAGRTVAPSPGVRERLLAAVARTGEGGGSWVARMRVDLGC